MSFIENLTEGIGELAKPLAPALDFLGIGPEQSPLPDGASVWDAIGQGVKSAVMAGPAGLAVGAQQLLGPMSGRDRLIFGSMLLAGGVGAARQFSQRWHTNKRLAPVSGLLESEQLGIPHGFTELSEPAAALARERPGIRGRQAQVLAGADPLETARALGKGQLDEPTVAGIAGVVDRYAALHPNGLDGAKVDLARFDHAFDHNLLQGPHNKPFRDVWDKFTSGQALTDDESQKLLQAVKALGDATKDIAADDLSIGLTARITNVDITPEGATLHVTARTPEVGDLFGDERYRARALTTLNVRAYAKQGYANFRLLWDIGMEDTRIRQEGLGKPLLPRGLTRGPDWYFAEHDNIAKAFGVDPKNSLAMARPVALVSLLSESQDWATNIEVAKRLSDEVFRRKEVLNEDFQNWLQHGTRADYRRPNTRREYTGKNAKRHEKLFQRLHEEMRSKGFRVSAADLRKVLRLARETPEELFASTEGPKQKNFYLNLLYPDLEYPVTVDMHQFDAYYGLDSGTQDRPVNDPIGAGETSYNVIADVVRQLAADLSEELGQSVKPHQVQAVIWETWRELKRAHNGSWRNLDGTPGDPFRLKPAGGENPVFLALQGKGETEIFPSLFGAKGDTLPVATLEGEADGFKAILAPEGGVAYATSVDVYTDYAARHLYPAVKGADGVPRWVNTRPRWVHDPSKIRSTVAADPWAHVETYDMHQLGLTVGEWPGHGAQEAILFDGPPVLKTRGWLSKTKPIAMGGVSVDGVALDHTPVWRSEITDHAYLSDVLTRHAWAIVEDPKAANAARIAGYDPIRLSPGGWLVIGPDAQTAKGWGGKVITNAGELPQRELSASVDDLVRVMRENPDGFTFDPATGELASSGVAMAESGAELRISPAELDSGVLEEWFEQHQVWLSRPGMHVGGWYNEADGMFVLDVSRVLPKGTPADEIQRLLDEGFQEAAFDLDNLQEIRNPNWDAIKDQAEQPRPPAEFELDLGLEDGPFRFRPDDFTVPAEDDLLARAVRQATRYMLPLDRDQIHTLELIAEDIERRGGSNLVIHTTRNQLDGFVRAREYTYTNGNQLQVVRTRDLTAGQPNAVPVWVRSNSNLPDSITAEPAPTVKTQDGAILNNAVRLVGADELGPGTYSVDSETWTIIAGEGAVTGGKKWTIDVGDQPDMVGPVRQAEVLIAAGVDPTVIEFKTPQGRFGLQGPTEPSFERTPVIKTKFGGPAPKSTSSNLHPDDIYVGQFRISPKFKMLDRGKIVDVELDPTLLSSTQRALETFLDRHERAAEVWRLPGITVDSVDDGAFAYVPWEPGSPVLLTKSWWADPGALRASLTELAKDGFFVQGSDPVATVVAHELGHVLHGATALQQGWKKDPDINKALRSIVKKHGGPGAVGDVLSRRAAVDESELVAEAVASVLFGKPSKLAQEVYDTVNGAFEDAFKYRGLLWKTA